MLMTPEEAKKKWCPHARFIIQPDGFHYDNRPHHERMDGLNGFCLGPDCAAWRWRNELESHGYCGIAGRTE